MRIDRLDLVAFGPFTDASLDLSGGREGLHLIHGPNEAGKTSALRAIRQFFQGIPARSTDDFIHKHAAMRIGTRLRGRSGTFLELVRRKGNKNTLLTPDGTTPDDADARLLRFLGGVSADEFLRKFTIDHAELVEGGKALIKGGGDLGQMLFAAGVGFASLGRVQKQLDDDAEVLFKRGGSKPRINADFATLEATRKKMRSDQLSSTEWVGLQDALSEALTARSQIDARIEQDSRERARLDRLDQARKPAARLQMVNEALTPLADVPRLPDDFAGRCQQALAAIRPLEDSIARARRKIDELTARLAEIQVPHDLLDEADAIEDLFRRFSQHEQAVASRERLLADRDACDDQVRNLLRALGHDPDALGSLETPSASRLESLRLTTTDRTRVQELVENRQALQNNLVNAEKALQDQTRKRDLAIARLAELGPERDATALKRAIKRAQREGDLDTALRDARDKLAQSQKRDATALKSLGLWSGTLDELATLAIPPIETIERFGSELDDLASVLAQLGEQIDALDTNAANNTAALEALELAGDIPTEDALSQSRAERDGLWNQARQARALTDALADAYESALRRADDLADRLRREAERVAKRAGLVAERNRLKTERARLRARLDDAERGQTTQLNAWRDLWRAIGVQEPLPPREMSAWHRRHAKLAENLAATQAERDQVAALESRIVEQREAVSEALAALGEPTAEAEESLADLLDRADAVVEAVRKESDDRKRLSRDHATLDAEGPALVEAHAAARAQWNDWLARWTAAMTRIGQPADTSPQAANAVVQQTDAIFELLDRAREHRRAIAEIEHQAGAFRNEVKALAERVAPDLDVNDGFDPGEVVRRLHARLKQANELRRDHEELTARLEEETRTEQADADRLVKLQSDLEVLRRQARCQTDDELLDVAERARQRQLLDRERDDLVTHLRTLAAGTPLDAFLRDAEQAIAEQIADQLRNIGESIARLNHEKDELNQTIGARQSDLNRMNGSAAAADASEQIETLRARIRDDAEQYARLRLASTILRTSIERYRQKSQGPVLGRASDLFSRLTLGSFEGLRDDYDANDQPVLVGVRPGGAVVHVEGMSLGTADQLYLALRLATLETLLDRDEPLPLIVDDILIQFDDARARATLEVLAEFSRRTQVLLFTHHEHLTRLARAVAPDDLIVHPLDVRSRVA